MCISSNSIDESIFRVIYNKPVFNIDIYIHIHLETFYVSHLLCQICNLSLLIAIDKYLCTHSSPTTTKPLPLTNLWIITLSLSSYIFIALFRYFRSISFQSICLCSFIILFCDNFIFCSFLCLLLFSF